MTTAVFTEPRIVGESRSSGPQESIQGTMDGLPTVAVLCGKGGFPSAQGPQVSLMQAPKAFQINL